MAIHRDLPDAELHEPKGMQPLTGGATDAGKVIVSDGAGGTEVRRLNREDLGDDPVHYGELDISANTTPLALTAAVDPTLSTNTDYIQITGIWDAIPHGSNEGIVQGTDSLTITQSGVYRIDLWCNIFTDTVNNAIAFKHAKNGVITLVRRPKQFLATTNTTRSLAAFGIYEFTAGDVVTLWIASDKTANITIEDGITSLTLLKAIV